MGDVATESEKEMTEYQEMKNRVLPRFYTVISYGIAEQERGSLLKLNEVIDCLEFIANDDDHDALILNVDALLDYLKAQKVRNV